MTHRPLCDFDCGRKSVINVGKASAWPRLWRLIFLGNGCASKMCSSWIARARTNVFEWPSR